MLSGFAKSPIEKETPEQLAGKIQERHGVARDEAGRQIAAWERKATDAWFEPRKEKV